MFGIVEYIMSSYFTSVINIVSPFPAPDVIDFIEFIRMISSCFFLSLCSQYFYKRSRGLCRFYRIFINFLALILKTTNFLDSESSFLWSSYTQMIYKCIVKPLLVNISDKWIPPIFNKGSVPRSDFCWTCISHSWTPLCSELEQFSQSRLLL